MQVYIEKSTPAYSGEIYVGLEVIARVVDAAGVRVGPSILDLPENATEQVIKAAILAQWQN